MEIINNQIQTAEVVAPIHWGHFGTIMAAIVLLAGITWMQKPQLFSFKKNQTAVSNVNIPKYYAYVQPAEDSVPLVAGAATNQGPMIINEDGTVSPVDMGQVLGASTQDVKLSLDDVKVAVIPDSDQSIKKYFTDSNYIQNGPIDNVNFENALSSGNQQQINQQAQKLIGVRDSLQKLPVPQGLVKLAKLTIVQYNAAIGVLQNFTDADKNPELVGQYLSQFLKSQQDLDAEYSAVGQKYNVDPITLGSLSSNDFQINNAQ